MHTKPLDLETSQEREACTTGFRLQRTLQQHPLYIVSVQCLPDHRTTSAQHLVQWHLTGKVQQCESCAPLMFLSWVWDSSWKGGCGYYPTGMLKVTAVCG